MDLFALTLIFLATSILSVVTGSTSLITVPVLLQFGMEPRSAVATNMLAITLMSVGGSLSFRGRGLIDRRRMPLLAILTLGGSFLGAFLLLIVPSQSMPAIISILMIAVVFFSLARHDKADSSVGFEHSRAAEFAGYTATFALGVYGGFFSGGYVTILTAAFVALFGMTFLQAVCTTKLVNVVSSLVATVIFMWKGLVDYRLGVLLGVVMLIGGLIGGKVALRLSNLWLRRIYLATVTVMALKILLFDTFHYN